MAEREDVTIDTNILDDKLLSGFDRIAAGVQQWGQKVDSMLARSASFAAQHLPKMTEGLKAAAEGDLSSIGGTLGSIVGLYFGPVGSLAGKEIGERIGGAIGPAMSDKLMSSLGSLGDTFDQFEPLVEQVRYQLSATGDIGVTSFERIQAIVDGIDLSNPETAADNVSDAFRQIGNVIDESVVEALARLALTIDQTFDAFREPLADIADGLQNVGVYLGLVDEQTDSWGDSIRNATGVGEKAIKALAYGFGYLQGVFIQVGGHLSEYVTLPIVELLEVIIPQLAKAAKALSDATGGALFSETAKSLDTLGESFAGFRERLQQSTEAAKNFDIKGNAEQWRDWIPSALERGRELMRARDEVIAARMKESVETPISVPVELMPSYDPNVWRATAASIYGTQEQMRAQQSAKAALQGASVSGEKKAEQQRDKIANAIGKNNDKLDEMNRKLTKIGLK